MHIQYLQKFSVRFCLFLLSHKDKESDFLTLCQKLKVTDEVCDRAWRIWETVLASGDIVPVSKCSCSQVSESTNQLKWTKLWGDEGSENYGKSSTVPRTKQACQ